MSKIREMLGGGEKRETLTPEQEIERYAELLLTDPEGNDRVAVAEHILPAGVENGAHKNAQARFYREGGGYIIDEYRDGGSEVLFQSFVRPNPDYDSSNPDSHKWDTGMLRMKWMRFSVYDRDNIEPVLSVVRVYFGELPEDRR